jgi:hypothetical protein
MKCTRSGECDLCGVKKTATAEGWFAEGLAIRLFACKAAIHKITKHPEHKLFRALWIFFKRGTQMVGLIALVYLLWIVWAITWPIWQIHEWMD